jgi:hypothetical protein
MAMQTQPAAESAPGRNQQAQGPGDGLGHVRATAPIQDDDSQIYPNQPFLSNDFRAFSCVL